MKILDKIKNIVLKFPALGTSYKVFRSYLWVLESKYYGMKTKSQRKDITARKYKKITGQELDWGNLQTYNEKMQYYKFIVNHPIKTMLVDKYRVREWVAEIIGEEYLIPLLGVWEKFEEIDFSKLPNQFVLKSNHAAGTNIVVSDKSAFNKKEAKVLFNNWLKVNYAYFGLYQMQYENIPPKIIAEQYIQDSKGELPEFKFFCFHGKVHYCWFILETETQRYGNVYDLEWNLQPWKFKGRENAPFKVSKPKNFEKMVDIAAKLSEGFSHVRVDLYNVDGKIFFGEMTFTSAGGYRLVTPEKYNHMLGDLW